MSRYTKEDRARDDAKRAAIESRFPDCMQCGAPFYAQGGFSLGYGWSHDMARRICYACCGDNDRVDMLREGRATLYLSKNARGWRVTNWPGSLEFRVDSGAVHKLRHPFTRDARIAYFRGPEGATWSARNIGDSQIAHCRRLKA
jgi:hypothetical protein